MSVMEMSHRGKEFISIHAEAESLLRELLGVPANYKVLFLQGGAIGENAIVPMNLLRGKSGKADYVDTGEWSKKSIKEAQELRQGQRRRQRRGGQLHRHPEAARVEARPGRRLRAHLLATRPSAASSTTGRPTPATCRWWPTCRRNILSRPVDVSQVRPDLRRRAEEHRPGGPDDRHRARRPDRPGAADHALGLRLQAAGRQRLDVQHAADLRDLHRRAGVQAGSRRRAA